MPLPDTRGFLELVAGHLRSPWRSDEPEILRYSIRQFGPIGADAGQPSCRKVRGSVDGIAANLGDVGRRTKHHDTRPPLTVSRARAIKLHEC